MSNNNYQWGQRAAGNNERPSPPKELNQREQQNWLDGYNSKKK